MSLLSLSRSSALAFSVDALPRAASSLPDSISFSACAKTRANDSSAILAPAALLYRPNASPIRSAFDMALSSMRRSRPESDGGAGAGAAGSCRSPPGAFPSAPQSFRPSTPPAARPPYINLRWF